MAKKVRFTILVLLSVVVLLSACGEAKYTLAEIQATQKAEAREAAIDALLAQANTTPEAPEPTATMPPAPTQTPVPTEVPATPVPQDSTQQISEAPQAENNTVVSLRYDNAGCETNTGLASGQDFTVAYIICNANSPIDAWSKIQVEINKVGAFTYTADSGTETTIALPLGTAWAMWNSTCPTDPLKVDVSRPSQELAGPGCIRFMPEFGGGDRVMVFEQAVAVH